jgi:hypothetical protein
LHRQRSRELAKEAGPACTVLLSKFFHVSLLLSNANADSHRGEAKIQPKCRFQDPIRFQRRQLIRPPHTFNSQLMAVAESFVNASMAASSWSKYQSGLNAFTTFEQYENSHATWPLRIQTLRRFATWGLTVRRLQPSSVEAYCSALNFVHHLKGLTPCDWTNDPIFNLLLKGVPKTALAAPPKPNVRHVVSLLLLKLIGHRITLTGWDPLSKQVVWTLCVTAFFSSARLGELLAPSEHVMDPTSTLLWTDVQFRDDSVLLHIRSPKSGNVGGDFLDINIAR